MATLQRRNGSFRILFYHGGRRHTFTVGAVDGREAELAAADVDRVLLRLEQRLLTLPAGVDVVACVRNGGRVPGPEAEPVPAACPLGLKGLRERYLAVYSSGAMEASSLRTARIHLDHVTKTLGATFSLQALAAADLQRHIDRRVATKSSRGRKISTATVRKELATFRAAWNWALTMGLVQSPFPNRGLVYPKTDEKPPFQTREEIERQIARGGLAAHEVRVLWDSLFLTLPEIAAVLESVKEHATRPWVYPMACTAAHTGARRSELLRLRIDDVDLTAGTVLLREKKRSKGRRTTRRVPLSPFLTTTLGAWLAGHPGGAFLFCQEPGPVQGRAPREAPTPVTRDEAHDHLRRTLLRSEWSVVRGWHVLRHSFASNCAAGGVDQRLIDEWLGHTTEEMRRRYRHLIPSRERQAIRSVFEGPQAG